VRAQIVDEWLRECRRTLCSDSEMVWTLNAGADSRHPITGKGSAAATKRAMHMLSSPRFDWSQQSRDYTTRDPTTLIIWASESLIVCF
jgi:hypothetical protein